MLTKSLELTKRPVIAFYMFVFLFISVVPVDVEIYVRFIASLFVLFVFVLYFIGSNGKSSGKSFTPQVVELPLEDNKRFSVKKISIIIVLQLASSIYVGHFYTGISFIEALSNLSVGTSNYLIYQEYFSTSELSKFTISKIPAILLNYYVKLSFILVLYHSLVLSNRRIDIVIVFVSALSVLLLSIFRGTSLEFFEVLLGVLCALYVKSKIFASYRFPTIKLAILASLFVVFYLMQILFRYDFNYIPSCNNAFCYNDEGLLHNYLPAVSLLLEKLSSYFYFAPDYMARLFIYALEGNFLHHFILPLNGVLADYHNKWLCDELIKCGPTWSPDFERMLYVLGLPVLCLLIFVLSRYQRFYELNAHKNFTNFLGYYLLTLQITAFPIGNFLLVSSANQLALITFLILINSKMLSKKIN